jgi:hypothetical protein
MRCRCLVGAKSGPDRAAFQPCGAATIDGRLDAAVVPADWRATREAWDRYHALSSNFAGIALVMLLAVTLRAIPSSPLHLAFDLFARWPSQPGIIE